ncbi:MAG: class I SAM-dependent methyltransferase [Treponema sp.]|jgi:ubiquinone/menaquinone biosynthesis C-methylase UbiE|nr:class I SAM-dependent methyltransferase [Treponema sp.]
MMQYMRKIKDVGITGSLAKWYDKNSRENRREELQMYAKEISRTVKAGDTILEVAPGPGYVLIELAKLGNYHLSGMDISADFVEIGKTNAKREKATVTFVQGTVSSMPFNRETFDFLFCSAAFKNFHDPAQALREMHRVLKPGGQGLIIDMNKNTTAAIRKAEVAKMHLHGFNYGFMRFAFGTFLRNGAYTKKGFEQLLAVSPFSSWNIAEQDISLYVYLYK